MIGRGLEADQKVIAAHGCYAMTATSALTAQNTQGVYGILETPPEFVKKQIEACIEDIGVDVVKTGMLATMGTVTVVADALRKHGVKLSVVDPVMVATSGAQLLPEDAVTTLCGQLLPLTYLVTPNIPEAKLMLQKSGAPPVEVHDLAGLRSLARAVHQLGPKYVLLKGGHVPLTADFKVARTADEKVVVANVLYGQDVDEVFQLAYQQSRNTHGTGCTLASAIACHLAQGCDVSVAVRSAGRYVEATIKTSVGMGKGSGPLNHFHSLQSLPFPPGGFVEYILERDDVKAAWHEYTNHDFVQRMGDGTLAVESFKHYMTQDYLYLIHFARANALAGYKAKTLDDIAGAAAIVTHIRHEINLHINECKEFGLTQDDMARSEESQACTAYSRYVLDIGQSEDWLAMQISLLPCLLGYAVIARRLQELQSSLSLAEPNRYATWINNYVAEDYTAAVDKGCALIEKHATKQSPSRISELVSIFIHATRMETGFWEMASKA
ncbi:trifunctional hydroxymethylpyrimidine kinase/phosphomethylpyrimidine kinase/thiaminase [Teratosphaeriaceae sp. CCFEE 6253]|nr:trifunctional hydroxymethylpyrimidine kinase/phosphomethylpyrimidine kinase/thiaminase [Teratosphaeriaceae sp. CCFEE 6253]